MPSRSGEELIVDEGVPADVAFDEEAAGEGCQFFEDEGDEEGVVDVVGGDEENVDEVDVEEKEQKFVSG